MSWGNNHSYSEVENLDYDYNENEMYSEEEYNDWLLKKNMEDLKSGDVESYDKDWMPF